MSEEGCLSQEGFYPKRWEKVVPLGKLFRFAGFKQNRPRKILTSLL